MTVPKKKRSRSRARIKESHWRAKVKSPNLALCSQCQKPLIPHHVCFFCGTYKSRQVIDIEAKEKKKEKKRKKLKEEAQRERE